MVCWAGVEVWGWDVRHLYGTALGGKDDLVGLGEAVFGEFTGEVLAERELGVGAEDLWVPVGEVFSKPCLGVGQEFWAFEHEGQGVVEVDDVDH